MDENWMEKIYLFYIVVCGCHFFFDSQIDKFWMKNFIAFPLLYRDEILGGSTWR